MLPGALASVHAPPPGDLAPVHDQSRQLADAIADIDSAADGATVTLSAATHTWSSVKTISKTLTIQGAGRGSTILDRNNGGSFFRIFSGGDVTVRDLTMMNGRDETVGADSWLRAVCSLPLDCGLAGAVLLQ